jgi:hypothetical protein
MPCSSGPWPLSRPPSLLVERAEDGRSLRASRVGCPGSTGTLACRERAGFSSELQSASRVGSGTGGGFSGGGWSMIGFLEVESSIFLFPWGMVRRTSRLWELLRRCAGSACRSGCGQDHECGHRQDHYRPPNLLNTLRGIVKPTPHAHLSFMQVK